MALRIAIVDDQICDAEYVQQIITGWATKRTVCVDTELFSSAEAFMFCYAEDKSWDVLLLDIEMGAMDGLSMAKKLRQDNKAVQIIFVTGFPDYIAEGYEVSALHYLMKPVSEEKMAAALDRAFELLKKPERAILLKVDGDICRVPVAQIEYVEAFAHSVVIQLTDKTLSVRVAISEIENMLGDGFVRCHRSYLVGVKYISRLSKSEVFLDSGKTLPLSRTASSAVHKAFISYYIGDSHETI